MKAITIIVANADQAEAINNLLAEAEEDGKLDFTFSVRIKDIEG